MKSIGFLQLYCALRIMVLKSLDCLPIQFFIFLLIDILKILLNGPLKYTSGRKDAIKEQIFETFDLAVTHLNKFQIYLVHLLTTGHFLVLEELDHQRVSQMDGLRLARMDTP